MPDPGRRCPELPDIVADARASEKGFEGYDDEREAGDPPQDRSGKQAQAEGVEGKEEKRMSYLVRAWWAEKPGDSHNDLWEFDDLNEANDFADWKAKQLRKYGYEFDVRVYQLIG